MANLDDELDEIIAREKPGYRRVRPTAGAASPADTPASSGTADLIRKYLGGKGQKNEAGDNPGNDVAIVHVRPEHESDDPRQNVSKAVVISRSRKKIIGEQG